MYYRCKPQLGTWGLLGQPGFMVSWKKYKIDKLFLELACFDGLVRATKRQLHGLCGILSYSAEVIKGARTFLGVL